MFGKSSEYEPLIEANNPFYNELSQNKNRKKPRTFPYKTIIFITVLIIIGVCIYELSGIENGINNNPSSISSMSSKKYNFIQAEQAHQHTQHVPKSWEQKEECTDEHPFILTMALRQQNTETLHEHVAAVSHPRNTDTYHKYWSSEKVRTFFKPSDEALTSVVDWLKENGFTKDNGKIDMVSQYGNVLRVSLTCGQANKLLNTKYMFYENKKNGKRHLRVKDGIYNIPDTIHQHIDFMSPTIRFPLERHTLKVQTMSESKLAMVRSHTKDSLVRAKKTENNSFKKDDDDEGDEDMDSDEIPNIPSKIYELYGMDSDTMEDILGTEDDIESMDDTVARQAIASFIEQYYSDVDINLFWEDLDVYPESTMCRVPDSQPQGYGSEAELDTQYITSTGKGIYTYVYYIDSDDIFVSLAEAILDTDIPPLVVSISYGADEYELGQDWVTRCNEEFGKLALIGTTVLASSGDSGIRGNDDDCLYGDASSVFEGEEVNGGNNDNKKGNKDRGRHLLNQQSNIGKVGGSGKSNNKGSSKGKTSSSSSTDYTFVASFPASAPYVTAVGGTEGGTVQTDISTSTGETAWLYSGGGFSIYFDTPEWQQSAVSDYLNNCDELPDEARYVSTGRAYPDISAQSVDYVIAYDSSFYLVSGTSASSPTVAGMISMINYARIKAGKQALGFLNPSLYSLYDEDQTTYFNDVIEGYNIGCECDDNIGFQAAEGWDPITGVGTPKFSQIYQALLALD